LLTLAKENRGAFRARKRGEHQEEEGGMVDLTTIGIEVVKMRRGEADGRY